jgi:hypothetical protein
MTPTLGDDGDPSAGRLIGFIRAAMVRVPVEMANPNAVVISASSETARLGLTNMTPAPPGVRHGRRRPFLACLPRALWGCLVNYPIATVGSLLSTRVFAHWLQLDPIDAVLGWFASALLASGVWYSLEPWVQRLWGERPPTERQWLRLEAVVVERVSRVTRRLARS